MSNELSLAIATAKRHERHERRVLGWLTVVVILLLLILGLTVAQLLRSGMTVDALSVALESSRKQVVECADMPPGTAGCEEPVAPSASEVIQDPDAVQPVEIKPLDPEALETAARAVLAEVLPVELEGDVAEAVATYVTGCVASGDCVGPAGPPGPEGPAGPAGEAGADGTDPTPVAVAAAVASVCEATVDCEVTPEDLAQAVAKYCTGTGMCGTKWTESQIQDIALEMIAKYFTGRPSWCPPVEDIEPGEPIGPCYASVG